MLCCHISTLRTGYYVGLLNPGCLKVSIKVIVCFTPAAGSAHLPTNPSTRFSFREIPGQVPDIFVARSTAQHARAAASTVASRQPLKAVDKVADLTQSQYL